MATNVIGSTYLAPSKTAWGAIFGGTFVYLAIMATFGALGAAIFASARSSAGMVVWMTILGIISLYFAGRAASHLAGTPDRNIGMYHGLITFGMSVFSTILVLGIGFASAAPYSSAANAGTNVRWDAVTLAAHGGWALFVALFLGFLAAMIGGAHAAPSNAKSTTTERPDLRRVA